MNQVLDDSHTLVVTAPDLQQGLSREIEQGVIPKRYLNRYSASHEVRCAFCPGHTPHFRGFTVEMEDGRIALCGIDCARKFFGDEIAARFEYDLEKQINEAHQRRAVSVTVEGAPISLEVLDSHWIEIESAYISAVQGIILWLEGFDISRALSGNALEITRQKKVMARHLDRHGNESTKPTYVESVQGRVLGARCLLTREKPLSRARGGLVSLCNWAERPEMIKGKVVNELSAKRRQIISSLEDGISFAKMAHTFFQVDNLNRFAIWYQRKVSESMPEIEIKHGNQITIQHPKKFGATTVTALPGNLPDPSLLLDPLKNGQDQLTGRTKVS